MKRLLVGLLALLVPALAGAQDNGAFITYRGPAVITSGTTPINGGATTQVCFNNAGKLACGDSGFTFDGTTDTLTLAGPGIFGNGSTVAKGTGSATAVIGGVLNVNTTSQATTGTAEEVLATYTLPANTLSANGKGVRIIAFGASAANANVKITRIRFGGIGGTIIAALSFSSSAASWRLSAEVVRTGAATQITTSQSGSGATSSSQTVSASQTLSGTVDIVVTGVTATSAGDATFQGLIVEALN